MATRFLVVLKVVVPGKLIALPMLAVALAVLLALVLELALTQAVLVVQPMAARGDPHRAVAVPPVPTAQVTPERLRAAINPQVEVAMRARAVAAVRQAARPEATARNTTLPTAQVVVVVVGQVAHQQAMVVIMVLVVVVLKIQAHLHQVLVLME